MDVVILKQIYLQNICKLIILTHKVEAISQNIFKHFKVQLIKQNKGLKHADQKK